MIDIIRRRPIVAAVAALLLLFIVVSSFPIIPETKQAVVARFGKPVRILTRFEPGRPIGAQGAGISWRMPFAEQMVWIDKRVLDVDMQRQQVLSTDQRRLEVDAFARYRVIDPLRMYLAARSVENVEQALKPILGSQLRNELGKRPFASLLSPEREGAMENIRVGLNRISRQILARAAGAVKTTGAQIKQFAEEVEARRAAQAAAEAEARARFLADEEDAIVALLLAA